jgi:hypothetical protein
VLPFNAISVHGLLFLLTKWCFQPERLGGMRDVDHVMACQYLLQAMLKIVVLDGGVPLAVAIAKSWENSWPRPDPPGLVALPVSCDGLVSLDGWEVAATLHGGHSVTFKLLHKLKAALHNGMGLYSVMKQMSMDSELQGVFAQVVWQLGNRMQDALMRSLKGQSVAGVRSAVVDVGDFFDQRHRLDAHLVRYVQSCKATCAGLRT